MASRPEQMTRVQLCGRLSVELNGAQVAERLRGRQVRLLLVYLLLHRDRVIGREELVQVLWSGSGPASADAALRTLLSRLRSALGPDAVSGRQELMLNLPEPVWIDFHAAGSELQEAAATLERGDGRGAWARAQIPFNIASRGLVPGLQADWLEPFRRELEDMRLQALEVIGGAGLRMGGAQLASVERSARALIAADPYREAGYVLLMQAAARRGNLAEGVRVFERLRLLLREELGTTPSPGAIAAYDRLLIPESGETAPVAPSRAADDAPVALPTELQARAQTELVGRQAELSELSSLWAGARTGNPISPRGSGGPVARAWRLVVLAGDAGAGKTSLATKLAEQAYRDGGVVLAGRAAEEGLAPYQPFLEALRHYFTTADLEAVAVAVREYGPELARLVPEIRRRVADLAPAEASEPEGERYRLFEAMVGLFSAISEQAPILLLLDDLHWADRPTLLLLRHLARAPAPSRLLILIAYRSEASAETLRDMLSDLTRENLVTELEIGGLNQRETAKLIRLRAGETPSRSLVGALHRETEGNPLFLEEIVRNLVQAGVSVRTATASALSQFEVPEGVKRMIARRIDRLQPSTVHWLRVASVIGRDFDLALLEQVAGLEEEELLRALEEALTAAVVLESREPPGWFSFAHALVREALYEGMSAARRARIHRQVGEALEAGKGAPVSELAKHFTLAAGRDDAAKALQYARRAAEEAMAQLAYEEAAEHYARAVAVLRRFEPDNTGDLLSLLLDYGETCVKAGERALAWEAFREAADLADLVGDRHALARAAIGAARRYVVQPGVVETDLVQMLDHALEATAGERSLARVQLLSRQCGAVYYSAQRERMQGLSQEASDIAHELDDPHARTYAAAARRRALWDPRHLQERLAASTEMLTYAQEAGYPELVLQAHAWLVVDLLEAGDRRGVDAQVGAFTTGAERLRQPLYVWQSLVWAAMLALLDGSLERAAELADEALAAGGPAERVTSPDYHARQLFAIRWEQARLDELEPLVRELSESRRARPIWGAMLAVLYEQTGRVDQARVEFAALAGSEFLDVPQDGDWMATVAMLGDLASNLHDAERAAWLYELLLPYAGANVVVGLGAVCLGPAARVLGRLALTAGLGQTAAEHFERGLELCRGLRAQVWEARTRLDYALALAPSARARRMVEDAASVAQELDLPAVARQADRLRENIRMARD